MRCIVSFCYLLSLLAVISTQELEYFQKNSTVDFERQSILADIEPTAANPAYTTLKIGKIFGSTTKKPMKSTSSQKLIDQTEDGVRFPIDLSVEDTNKKATSPTLTETQESIRATIDSVNIGERTTSLQHDLLFDKSVPMPPKITYPVLQRIQIVNSNTGKNFMFRCLALGIPEPTYEWFKDGRLVNDRDKLIQAFSNGTLLVPNFSNREDGLYQCFARNQMGTSVSVKVPIVYERPPSDIPTNETENIVFNRRAGEPFSLKCANTPPTIPEYSKRWYLEKGSAQLPTTNRTGTDRNGVLRFAYLEKADSAAYKCALAPELASSNDYIKFYNTATLEVSDETIFPSPPKSEYSSTTVKGILGGNANLECFFSGNPVPTITWKKSSNQDIMAGDTRFHISDFGRRLTVTEVREADSGIYTCTGNNGHGIVFAKVTLNVTAPPQKKANEGLIDLIIPDGRNVQLKCKAKVVAQQHHETPVWYRNGQLLNESSLPFPTRYSFTSDHSELHIENLKKGDTACFQCNISNSEGYLFYDSYLRVIDSIKITRRPKEHIVLAKGNAVDISVTATRDECCKTDKRWLRNGKDLTWEEIRKPPFIWSDDDNVLIFNTSGVDDASLSSKDGNYTCRLSNDYEEVEIAFSITWKDSDPSTELIQVKKGGIELWWIGLVLGVLLIALAVVIVIVFIKSNYPKETYLLEKQEIKHHLNPEQDLLDKSFQEI